MNGLLEIQTTQKWLIDYDFGIRAMRLVNAMLNGHLIQDADDKVYGYYCNVLPNGEFAVRTADDNERGGYGADVNEPFIDVLLLEGPITRNGDACTYGSRQLRDMMMEAADTEGCIGHLWLINGPGGVSNAIPDLQQAVDYARGKGQPIVGRIDGICASAHCWAAAMCDEVYYNNPTDMIGSVGIYWAGITNKDGDTDPNTGGTWHIVYDPESYDKNRFVRDLADNNDDKLIVEELKKDGEAFRNYIKERRPHCQEEHLHGKMFEVKDVEGILVTGQATMQETFNRIVELAGQQNKSRTGAKAAASTTMTAGAAKENIINPLNNSINMKEKFPQTFALLGVEEMECNEEGTFFNTGLLQTLEAKVAEMQQANAEAKALVEQLTAEKQSLTEQMDQLKADHQQAIDTMKADAEKAQNDMECAHKQALEAKDQEIASLNEKIANQEQDITAKEETIGNLQNDLQNANKALGAANKSIEEKDATIAERDQQINDLNAQVEELTKAPGNEPQAGKSPESNGQGGEAPKVVNGTVYAYDSSKSYEENMRLKKEWEQAHH